MAGLQNNIIDDNYNKLYGKFLEGLKNYHYYFEISKCCGYSEMVSCTKEDTLKKLYDHISYIFRNTKIKLFILHGGQKLWIPPSNDIFIKDYLREMREFLKPEYPIPCEIIYKIYIDDGHCVIGHQGYKPVNPSPFVVFNCKFHENPELENKKNDT